jgi:hypothetical protein
MTYVAALAGVAALLALWLDGLRARERVLLACADACRQANVQLLDHSVALASWRLRRADGRVVIERVYVFEYSGDGADRWHGRATLRGAVLAGVDLLVPGGRSGALS